MFDVENYIKQALGAFYPSEAVSARVKERIRPRRKGCGASVAFVNRDSEKIIKAVFKRYEKLMQNIA